ncbi:MAG TPA: NTP transferase domain-containing protein [Solirubrobacter sp.]|nr:NTP transferase domain-containing protein [Solirubrobacter sp.]
MNLPVCILAGGLGTRLGERVRDTPKPLIEVAGKPFLLHQLGLLRGAPRVVLCVGYLGERIEAALGYEQYGIELRYRYDDQAGTAAAVRGALPDLGERFFVLYGDTYLRIDYAAVAAAAERWPALMTVLHNRGRWDAGNVEFRDGRVVRYEKGAPRMEWIDYGLSVLTPAALDSEEPDLAQVFSRLAAAGQLGGFEATKRFYEIGTPEALAETKAFLSEIAASAAPGS